MQSGAVAQALHLTVASQHAGDVALDATVALNAMRRQQ